MKKYLAVLMSFLAALLLLTGCLTEKQKDSAEVSKAGEEKVIFTDSCGRKVEIPKQITKVSPSGLVSQIILFAAAPDKLVSLAGKSDEAQEKYLGEKYSSLPVTGQFFGKGKLNAEELIKINPQVIIDLGDKKENMEEDLDGIQEKTGIPVIFIEATVDTYPQAFRTLGTLLGESQQGEKLAQYTEETYKKAEGCRAKITQDQKLKVMFGTGESGLNCNAKGSIHCGVLEAVGVENAIEVPKVSNKGGGNTITMEEVIKADPDVILLDAGGPYEKLAEDPYWSGLKAVKDGRYYEIPSEPYHFLSNPPSINQIIGIKWLGNMLYPDIYQEDMVKELQHFYKLFWHYDLSKAEAEAILGDSGERSK